jgi:hypothetical protein
MFVVLAGHATVSLPFMLVLGIFTAGSAVPILLAQVFFRDRTVLVFGLCGSALSMGLLEIVLYQIDQGFGPGYTLPAWSLAAMAGYAVGSGTEYLRRLSMWLRLHMRGNGPRSA